MEGDVLPSVICLKPCSSYFKSLPGASDYMEQEEAEGFTRGEIFGLLKTEITFRAALELGLAHFCPVAC
jgi:hypothetical protein